MSDHSAALVPVEAWSYSSPDVRLEDHSIDIGLLAEALIYYDKVILTVANQPQFAELLGWFNQQHEFNTLLRLFSEETVQIYDCAFSSTAVRLPSGAYDLVNIQDEIQAEPNTFERRFLYHADVAKVLKNVRQRKQLYMALRDRVIEVKAAEFGAGVTAAKEDLSDPRRCSLILQAFLDDLYSIRGLGGVPQVAATVEQVEDGARTVHWGIDLDALAGLSGKIRFHRAAPLTAAALGNRFLWSAASLNCDLYLGSPMSYLVGDKLYESSICADKTRGLIEELEARVEFPSIRRLVNEGKLGVKDIMRIRRNASRFRNWLQEEAGRDRDAIIAYHLEVAKESGLEGAGRKTLRLFGNVGGPVVGAMVGTAVAGLPGTAAGAAAGGAVGFVSEVASKLGSGWRPVVFGNWLRERIEKVLGESPE